MNFADVASLATILSLPAAAIGVIYAAVQMRLSRKATSASVMLAASEAFRDAWSQLDANAGDPIAHHAAFADLMNLVEACCAVHRDGLLAGRSGVILDTYLVNTLAQIDQSDRARAIFNELMETDRTYEEIAHFLATKGRARRDFLSRLQVNATARGQ